MEEKTEEITEIGFYYVDDENKTKYQANVKDISELNIVGKIQVLYYTINRIFDVHNILQIFKIKNIPLFKITLTSQYFRKSMRIFNCDINNLENNYFEYMNLMFCAILIHEPILITGKFLLDECNIKICGDNLYYGDNIDIPYLIKASYITITANTIYHESQVLKDMKKNVGQLDIIENYKNKIYDKFDYSTNLCDQIFYINTSCNQKNKINFKNINCTTFEFDYCKGKFTIPDNVSSIGIRLALDGNIDDFKLNTENIEVLTLSSADETKINNTDFILNYPTLKYLEINSSFKINYLPNLKSLSHLREISIANNILLELPELPDSIDSLYLNNNRISKFSNIPSLDIINLIGNPIDTIYKIKDLIKVEKDTVIYLVDNKILSLKEYAASVYIKNIIKYNIIYEVSKYFDFNKLSCPDSKKDSQIIPCDSAGCTCISGDSIINFLKYRYLVEEIKDGCAMCSKCKRYSFKYRHINYDYDKFCCCV